MRYYKIIITDKNGKQFRAFNSQGQAAPLRVEFDLPITEYAYTDNEASVRVYGVPFEDLSQTADMNGMSIQIFAGMQQGLPLANPAYAGLIMQGTIFRCFGNWQGTTFYQEFVIGGTYGLITEPKNFTFDWRKGQKFNEALEKTLKAAFSNNFTFEFYTDERLIINYDCPHYCRTLNEFAKFIKDTTASVIGGDYRGVSITVQGTVVYITDDTYYKNRKPKEIKFQDMVGQPIWLSPGMIQVQTVMRGDIRVSDLVRLPKVPMITTPGAQSQYPISKQQSIFQGDFRVQKLRHVGDSRSPNQWLTVFDLGFHLF